MLHVLKLHNIRYSCRWLFHVNFKRDKITAYCTQTNRGKAGQVSLEGVVGQLRPQVSQLYQSCMCISACTKSGVVGQLQPQVSQPPCIFLAAKDTCPAYYYSLPNIIVSALSAVPKLEAVYS